MLGLAGHFKDFSLSSEIGSHQMISNRGITSCDSGFSRITLAVQLRTGSSVAGKRCDICGGL